MDQLKASARISAEDPSPDKAAFSSICLENDSTYAAAPEKWATRQHIACRPRYCGEGDGRSSRCVLVGYISAVSGLR